MSVLATLPLPLLGIGVALFLLAATHGREPIRTKKGQVFPARLFGWILAGLGTYGVLMCFFTDTVLAHQVVAAIATMFAVIMGVVLIFGSLDLASSLDTTGLLAVSSAMLTCGIYFQLMIYRNSGWAIGLTVMWILTVVAIVRYSIQLYQVQRQGAEATKK